MKRPIPVILTAILLGVFAAFQLLGAASMAGLGFFVSRKGMPQPTAATPSPFSSSAMVLVMILGALFFLAVAIWLILTLAGLVRLRSWARYSILVIGACMAVLGGFGALTSLFMPAFIHAAQVPGSDPHMMRTMFLLTGAVYGLGAAVGVALFVYYSLAATRAVFAGTAPPRLTPPNTSTGRPRPTAVTVISWLFLIGGPFLLVYAFLPLPVFLFGFTLQGWSAHLGYAAIALFTCASGYGLLRLYNAARLAVFGWIGIGFLQLVVALTPWGTSRFRTAMDAMNGQMASWTHLPAQHTTYPAGLVILSVGFGFACNLVVLALLHRHRVAFTPKPLPPPMPALG